MLQDMLWETGKDIGEKKAALHTEEARKDGKLDGFLNGLIKLQEKGNCLSAGDRSSDLGYGEIGVFHALYTFNEINSRFLQDYPKLLAFVKAVADVPAIKNYLSSPRRMPLTQNELGKGNTGISGYTWIDPPKPESFRELYDK